MHKVKIKSEKWRTDLISEQELSKGQEETKSKKGRITCTNRKENTSSYTTIEFPDITDKDSFQQLKTVLKEELKKYIRPKKKDLFLVVGLGNEKSTPDSLGPKTIEKILVTRYLYLLGDLGEDYSCVAILKPDVCGNTGIESVKIIKNVIREIKPTKVILIDSLKAGNRSRLVKTIQITNTGIHPGSGIYNNQGEISKKTVGCDVIAIGVPTVVDMETITKTKEEDNFMVTPTNIDFLINRLSTLLGDSLNSIFHKVFFDN